MNGNLGVLTVHYRGAFDEGPPVQYANGVSVSKAIDPDYLMLRSLLGYIVDFCPHRLITKISFKGPMEEFTALRPLDGDNSVRDIIKLMMTGGQVLLYVDHGPHLDELLALNILEIDAENAPDEDDNEAGVGVEDLEAALGLAIEEPIVVLPIPLDDEGPVQEGPTDAVQEGPTDAANDDDLGVITQDPNYLPDNEEGASESDGEREAAGEDDRVDYVVGEEPVHDPTGDPESEEDDGEDIDDDLGSPYGSDPEQIEAVLHAQEILRRTGGGRRRKKKARTVRVLSDSSSSSSQGSRTANKRARVAPDNDAPYEDEYHSNGSTDVGSDGNCSDDPSCLRAPINDSQDFVPERKRERWYKPNTEFPLFCCGMRFEDYKQFKEAMAKYAILKRWAIHCVRSSPTRCKYKCRSTCDWQITSSNHGNDQTFRVKSYNSKHTCHKEFNSKLATQYWIAEYLSRRVKAHPFYKVAELRKVLKEDLGLEPSKDKVRRAKRIVLKEMVGNYKDEYKVVQGYANYLKSVNPGNTVKVCTARRNAAPGRPLAFQGMYFCFDAIKKGWKAGCRPIIGIDGCFLKGVCKGVLLVAVGRDANDHVYPIAWAVVEVESYETWYGFLKQVAEDLDLKDGEGITILSDRHKGILKAREVVLPAAEHRHCSRHLYGNWGKRHKGKNFRAFFWRCVRASFPESLKLELSNLRKKTEAGYKELAKLDGHNWNKAMFRETAKCDVPHNNISESFNSMILDARCLPIISMREWIYDYLLAKRTKMLQAAEKWKGDITPKARQRIQVNNILSRHCNPVPAGGGKYRVHDTLEGWVHTVSMFEGKCSCRYWQLNGIPCQHAMACLPKKTDPATLVSHYYKKEAYINTYQTNLECTRGAEMWNGYKGEKVEAPVMRCYPGRPRVNRTKSKDEVKQVSKNKTVLSRVGTKLTCSLCRSDQHTFPKCPNKKPGDKPKRTRKKSTAGPSTVPAGNGGDGN